MASIARPSPARSGERRFFLWMAVVLAVVTFGGFSVPVAFGRVDVASLPLQVHLHALAFGSWILLYVAQNVLADRRSMVLHRRLGWAATMLAGVMVPLGIAATMLALRRGSVPFFFPHNIFLAINVLGILGFGGLFAAAFAMRRRADWHARLMLCAAAMVSAPAFGRLLPMPLLGKWGPLAITLALLAYPVAGIVRDRLARGSVHRAWWVGGGVIAAVQVLAGPIAFSPPVRALAERLANGA